jgi:hypothetical protein
MSIITNKQCKFPVTLIPPAKYMFIVSHIYRLQVWPISEMGSDEDIWT